MLSCRFVAVLLIYIIIYLQADHYVNYVEVDT